MAEPANIFSGLKVVDFASFIAGPGAATILDDFGAELRHRHGGRRPGNEGGQVEHVQSAQRSARHRPEPPVIVHVAKRAGRGPLLISAHPHVR